LDGEFIVEALRIPIKGLGIRGAIEQALSPSHGFSRQAHPPLANGLKMNGILWIVAAVKPSCAERLHGQNPVSKSHELIEQLIFQLFSIH
jgi:hypothetical protein